MAFCWESSRAEAEPQSHILAQGDVQAGSVGGVVVGIEHPVDQDLSGEGHHGLDSPLRNPL